MMTGALSLPLVRCIHSLKTVQLIYLTVHLTYRRLLGRWEVVRVNWESASWTRLEPSLPCSRSGHLQERHGCAMCVPRWWAGMENALGDYWKVPRQLDIMSPCTGEHIPYVA